MGEAGGALALRRRTRRLVRRAAEPRGDRRRAGPALRRPRAPDRAPSSAARRTLGGTGGGRARPPAAPGPLGGFRGGGVAVVSLAKRIEEVFSPGRREPLVLAHDTAELQLLQRVRDEAHR